MWSTKDYLPRPYAKTRMGLKIRRRARLRRKEVADVVGRLSDEFGMTVPIDDVPIDEAEAGPQRLVLRGEEPIALVVGDGIAPTVRGRLAFAATTRACWALTGASSTRSTAGCGPSTRVSRRFAVRR